MRYFAFLLFPLLIILHTTVIAQEYVNIYGIKRGDSLRHVRQTLSKTGFALKQKSVTTESGNEILLYAYRKKTIVMSIVISQDRTVHWIDVNEKGKIIGGVKIGSTIYDCYQNGLKFTFAGHRDCQPLDDIICLIGSVKTLVDQKYFDDIKQYETTNNVDLLKKIIIKGIEL
jgi:hypothetical protein